MIAVLWSSRLFLAAACACALAQTPPDPDARIKLALSARPAGREELLQFRSPALSGALESPAALWDFLTSPRTPYLDRLRTEAATTSTCSP
jgi:hypothetical protein